MRRAFGVGALAIGVLVAVSIALAGPELAVDFAYGALSAAERINAVSSLRLHLLYMLGGVIAIVTLVYAHLRHRREGAQLELDRERASNERFGAAVEQLANDSTSVRMGAIYTFQRIARESSQNRSAIRQILRAFLQQTEKQNRSAAPDLQAAFDVLTTDPLAGGGGLELQSVNLRSTKLRGSRMGAARVEEGDFAGAMLTNSTWDGASLVGCNFAGARIGTFADSVFEFCNLQGATIEVANGARFVACDLTDATISVILPEKDPPPARIVVAESVIDGVEIATIPRRLSLLRIEARNVTWAETSPPRLESLDRTLRRRVTGSADEQLRAYIAQVVAVAEGRKSQLVTLERWLELVATEV